MTIQNQFITDENGEKIAVILSIKEYERLTSISFDNQPSKMSETLKKGIEHALEQSKNGLTLTNEEVMKQTKERYPKLF